MTLTPKAGAARARVSSQQLEVGRCRRAAVESGEARDVEDDQGNRGQGVAVEGFGFPLVYQVGCLYLEAYGCVSAGATTQALGEGEVVYEPVGGHAPGVEQSAQPEADVLCVSCAGMVPRRLDFDCGLGSEPDPVSHEHLFVGRPAPGARFWTGLGLAPGLAPGFHLVPGAVEFEVAVAEDELEQVRVQAEVGPFADMIMRLTHHE